MNRLTKDGYEVQDHTTVYEIVWKRYNEEYSEAEPRSAPAEQMPAGIKIWKNKILCEAECLKRTEEYKERKFRHINTQI